jgi:hypothetical protein
VAGDEDQDSGGYELHQTDHAEVKRAPGQRIDLPTDGDRADLGGKFRTGACAEIEHERPMAEQDARYGR